MRTPTTRHYFDHNASMPAEPEVIERFVELERLAPGNPGSLHATGRAAGSVLEEARERVAGLLGLTPEHVVFCSGGTEANNLALFGLSDGGPIACAATEHASVWEVAGRLGRVELPVDAAGYAVFDDANVASGARLVATVHGQNEVGTVQDIAAARALADALRVPLHVDAAQSVGRIAIDELVRSADTVALSAHKFGGLRGCGMLVGRGVPNLRPLLHGGGQEFGRRPGTPSPALAGANAWALELAIAATEQRAGSMRVARDAFYAGIHRLPTRLLTPLDVGLPNTAMIAFEDVDGRSLLPALDVAGVEASAGSACSSGSAEPPRVLAAMGLTMQDARRCVRFSVSHRTSVTAANDAAAIVVEVVSRLASRMKRSP